MIGMMASSSTKTRTIATAVKPNCQFCCNYQLSEKRKHRWEYVINRNPRPATMMIELCCDGIKPICADCEKDGWKSLNPEWDCCLGDRFSLDGKHPATNDIHS